MSEITKDQLHQLSALRQARQEALDAVYSCGRSDATFKECFLVAPPPVREEWSRAVAQLELYRGHLAKNHISYWFGDRHICNDGGEHV